jgi:hypothetical protein
MKTPLYLGQVDENGLHLIERLPDDIDEARRIVAEMNKDMGTDYRLIGDVSERPTIDLIGNSLAKFQNQKFSCHVENLVQHSSRYDGTTIEVTLKGYPVVE